MQYLGHTYTKKNLLFIQNSNLARHPISLFAKFGKLNIMPNPLSQNIFKSLNFNQRVKKILKGENVFTEILHQLWLSGIIKFAKSFKKINKDTHTIFF